MNRFLFLLIVMPFIWGVPAALANDAGEKLSSVQKKLEQEKQRRTELEKKAAQANQDVENNTRELVKIGKAIQQSEQKLEALEVEIAPLSIRQQEIKAQLTSDRRDIARLVLALERLRRTPPEALIAKPGAPLETAQTAMLMQNIVPVITRKTEKLKNDLRELQVIAETLSVKREKALAENQKYKDDQKKLTTLVQARRAQYRSATKDLKAQEATVQKIAREASTLQDLASRIRRQEDRPDKARQTPPPKPGRPQLPAVGSIKTAYGQKDDFGASSKGISIATRSGALIVSPMGGVVRFAGPFKNYGKIVILEHAGGYHSLIAGLDKIDTVVGQSLSAGEALGRMANSQNGGKTTLYYELRLNGQPINPSRKFSGLG